MNEQTTSTAQPLNLGDPLAGVPRCGTCPHFHRFREEPRGDCYRHPPGNERGSKWRPQVGVLERCCGEHPQLQQAMAPTVAVKAQPLTPAQAAKPDMARKGGRR